MLYFTACKFIGILYTGKPVLLKIIECGHKITSAFVQSITCSKAVTELQGHYNSFTKSIL